MKYIRINTDKDLASDSINYNCPNCGTELPLHSAVNVANENEKVDPKVGDVGVCWNCQELIVYTGPIGFAADGERHLATGVKVPTDTEMAALMTDPEVAYAISYTRQALAGYQEWKKRRGL